MKSFLALLVMAGFSNLALAFDHSHAAWTALLHKHVIVNESASQVDYLSFKKDAGAFDEYTRNLSAVTKAEYDGFSQEQKIAFLINAYNAFTIKIILEHYPVKSIKDIGSLFRNTWKIKFINLLGKEMSLDAIEHEHLRKNFNEPRVHFAINCAAKGCPALRSEAYTAEHLSAQLENQAKQFLRDSSRNRLDIKAMKLELSMIFKWFAEDFQRGGNTVQKFVSAFITDDPTIKAKLIAGALSVGYLDYDWNLNKAGN